MAKGIYKRGNIYWIAYAGLDGKVIRESSTSDKFKDAETLLIKRRQGIREGKMPVAPRNKLMERGTFLARCFV